MKYPNVDVNERDPEDGRNALLKLTRDYGHNNLIELVQPLIERGIDVNATDLNGWNALHNLCRYYNHKNFPVLILLLKESNIDMEAKTKKGYTALSLTVLENSNNSMIWKKHEVLKIMPIEQKSQEFSEVKYLFTCFIVENENVFVECLKSISGSKIRYTLLL